MPEPRKTILILAASHFQLPVIRYAKEQSYRVITVDNQPDNPGHALADESFIVSTTDREAVLACARERGIDGILAYASDPAALTAAYVADALRLPGNPVAAVTRLGIKSQYRQFLKDNGFNHPHFITLRNGDYRQEMLQGLHFPLMVKPTDSAGSKGVTCVCTSEQIPGSIEQALQFSRNKELIVEEFVEKNGCQIGGEAYAYNGEIVLMCLGDQRVNTSSDYKYVPLGMTFPAQLVAEEQECIRTELQRCIRLSGFNTGALNLEIMRANTGAIYLMEIGPRSGGNLLPELMRYTYGFDVARYSVEHALGHDVRPEQVFNARHGFFAYYAIHSQEKCIFQGIEKKSALRGWIKEEHIFLRPGKECNVFKHSGYVIGIWLLHFPDRDTMDVFFRDPYHYYSLAC